MKYILPFSVYLEKKNISLISLKDEDNDELFIGIDDFINSTKLKEVNIKDVLKVNNSNINSLLKNIDFINNNVFIKYFNDNSLKISPIEYSKDYETFLKDKCKFCLIYKKDSSNIDEPLYILLQCIDNKRWNETKLFINNNIKQFYDKLSSKTIEIVDGDKSYIYNSSNGNEWNLKNKSNNDLYKKYLRKDDFKKLLSNNDIKINII